MAHTPLRVQTSEANVELALLKGGQDSVFDYTAEPKLTGNHLVNAPWMLSKNLPDIGWRHLQVSCFAEFGFMVSAILSLWFHFSTVT